MWCGGHLVPPPAGAGACGLQRDWPQATDVMPVQVSMLLAELSCFTAVDAFRCWRTWVSRVFRSHFTDGLRLQNCKEPRQVTQLLQGFVPQLWILEWLRRL